MHVDVMISEVATLLAAASRLTEERPADENQVECFPTIALVINALAAEVGLKAAICRARGITSVKELKRAIREHDHEASSHNLKVLFDMLPPNEQHFVRETTRDLIPQDQTFLALVNNHSTMPPPALDVTIEPMTFEWMLDGAKLCFESWRYSYEPTHLIVGDTFVRTLAEAILVLLKPPPAETPTAPSPASDQS